MASLVIRFFTEILAATSASAPSLCIFLLIAILLPLNCLSQSQYTSNSIYLKVEDTPHFHNEIIPQLLPNTSLTYTTHLRFDSNLHYSMNFLIHFITNDDSCCSKFTFEARYIFPTQFRFPVCHQQANLLPKKKSSYDDTNENHFFNLRLFQFCGYKQEISIKITCFDSIPCNLTMLLAVHPSLITQFENENYSQADRILTSRTSTSPVTLISIQPPNHFYSSDVDQGIQGTSAIQFSASSNLIRFEILPSVSCVTYEFFENIKTIVFTFHCSYNNDKFIPLTLDLLFIFSGPSDSTFYVYTVKQFDFIDQILVDYPHSPDSSTTATSTELNKLNTFQKTILFSNMTNNAFQYVYTSKSCQMSLLGGEYTNIKAKEPVKLFLNSITELQVTLKCEVILEKASNENYRKENSSNINRPFLMNILPVFNDGEYRYFMKELIVVREKDLISFEVKRAFDLDFCICLQSEDLLLFTVDEREVEQINNEEYVNIIKLIKDSITSREQLLQMKAISNLKLYDQKSNCFSQQNLLKSENLSQIFYVFNLGSSHSIVEVNREKLIKVHDVPLENSNPEFLIGKPLQFSIISQKHIIAFNQLSNNSFFKIQQIKVTLLNPSKNPTNSGVKVTLTRSKSGEIQSQSNSKTTIINLTLHEDDCYLLQNVQFKDDFDIWDRLEFESTTQSFTSCQQNCNSIRLKIFQQQQQLNDNEEEMEFLQLEQTQVNIFSTNSKNSYSCSGKFLCLKRITIPRAILTKEILISMSNITLNSFEILHSILKKQEPSTNTSEPPPTTRIQLPNLTQNRSKIILSQRIMRIMQQEQQQQQEENTIDVILLIRQWQYNDTFALIIQSSYETENVQLFPSLHSPHIHIPSSKLQNQFIQVICDNCFNIIATSDHLVNDQGTTGASSSSHIWVIYKKYPESEDMDIELLVDSFVGNGYLLIVFGHFHSRYIESHWITNIITRQIQIHKYFLFSPNQNESTTLPTQLENTSLIWRVSTESEFREINENPLFFSTDFQPINPGITISFEPHIIAIFIYMNPYFNFSYYSRFDLNKYDTSTQRRIYNFQPTVEFALDDLRLVSFEQEFIEPIFTRLNYQYPLANNYNEFILQNNFNLQFPSNLRYPNQDLWYLDVRTHSINIIPFSVGSPIRLSDSRLLEIAILSANQSKYNYMLVFEPNHHTLTDSNIKKSYSNQNESEEEIEESNSIKTVQLPFEQAIEVWSTYQTHITQELKQIDYWKSKNKKKLLNEPLNPIRIPLGEVLLFARLQSRPYSYQTRFNIVPDFATRLLGYSVQPQVIQKPFQTFIVEKGSSPYSFIHIELRPIDIDKNNDYNENKTSDESEQHNDQQALTEVSLIPCLSDDFFVNMLSSYHISTHPKQRSIYLQPLEFMMITKNDLEQIIFNWSDQSHHMCVWVDTSKSSHQSQISLIDRPTWIIPLKFRYVIRIQFIREPYEYTAIRQLDIQRIPKKGIFLLMIFNDKGITPTYNNESKQKQQKQQQQQQQQEEDKRTSYAGMIRFFFKGGTLIQQPISNTLEYQQVSVHSTSIQLELNFDDDDDDDDDNNNNIQNNRVDNNNSTSKTVYVALIEQKISKYIRFAHLVYSNMNEWILIRILPKKIILITINPAELEEKQRTTTTMTSKTQKTSTHTNLKVEKYNERIYVNSDTELQIIFNEDILNSDECDLIMVSVTNKNFFISVSQYEFNSPNVQKLNAAIEATTASSYPTAGAITPITDRVPWSMNDNKMRIIIDSHKTIQDTFHSLLSEIRESQHSIDLPAVIILANSTTALNTVSRFIRIENVKDFITITRGLLRFQGDLQDLGIESGEFKEIVGQFHFEFNKPVFNLGGQGLYCQLFVERIPQLLSNTRDSSDGGEKELEAISQVMLLKEYPEFVENSNAEKLSEKETFILLAIIVIPIPCLSLLFYYCRKKSTYELLSFY